jgi:hypothetical protein
MSSSCALMGPIQGREFTQLSEYQVNGVIGSHCAEELTQSRQVAKRKKAQRCEHHGGIRLRPFLSVAVVERRRSTALAVNESAWLTFVRAVGEDQCSAES